MINERQQEIPRIRRSRNMMQVVCR